MNTTCIIPAYNEERSLPGVLEYIQKVHKTLVVVINDGSSDATGRVALAYGATVLHNRGRQGSGKAILRGLAYVYARNKKQSVVILDADGQHDPKYIPQLLHQLQQADVVIASRYLQGGPSVTSVMRQIGTRLIALWIRLWTGNRITDPTSGYRALNAKALRIYAKRYPNYFSEPEAILVAVESRLRVCEIPTIMKRRRFGRSSISPWKSIMLMAYIFWFIPFWSIRAQLDKIFSYCQ